MTVATEAYILVGALRLRAPGVFDRASTENVLRIIAAGLMMVPLLIVGGSLPLFVQVALGAATYPLALLLVRAVTVDEVRRLLASLPFGRRRPVPEPID